jgi:uncharacterized phage protein (TIGR01671 family)
LRRSCGDYDEDGGTVVREIKFRAWHPYFGYSFNVQETYDSWPWEKGCSYQSFNDLVKDTEKEEIVIEQFTGLKDKNGKEIYEGDICLAISTAVVGYIVFHNGRFAWTDGACHWDIIGNNIHDHNPIDTVVEMEEDMLVIGNIHKNGDLLK